MFAANNLAMTPPVRVLQGLVLANSHDFGQFEDSEESPKGIFFIDAALMWTLESLRMTGRICL